MAAPASHTAIRRISRIERLTAGDLAPEWLEEFERTLTLLDQSAEREEQLGKELTLRESRVGELEDELAKVKKSFALMNLTMAQDAAGVLDDDETADDTPPQSVREAVERAAARVTHVEFASSAYVSADDSPFENPESILEALLALDKLAAMWAQPGSLGRSLKMIAEDDLGLTWRGDVSDTTTGGNRARYYETTWHNETHRLGPHVNLGSGSGAGKIARIYFFQHDPGPADERRFIVGHVGRKLPDSTTG